MNLDDVSALLTQIFSNLDPISDFQSLPAEEIVFMGELRSSACASIGLHYRCASNTIMNKVECLSNRRKERELTLRDHDISFPCLFRRDLPHVGSSFFHGRLLQQHQRSIYNNFLRPECESLQIAKHFTCVRYRRGRSLLRMMQVEPCFTAD